MLDVASDSSLPSAAMLMWSGLWPTANLAPGKGWSEQLAPGIHVLVDDAGADAAQWLPVLAGHARPGSGRIQCAGVCSQAQRAEYVAQVYWFNPRVSLHDREMSAQQWVQDVATQWPHWSDAEWMAHSHGFALESHMHKPLWHLSTGTLRKLGIAAALASGARLTLISEPVAALDGEGIRYLSRALERLGEDLTLPGQHPRWILVAHWEPLPQVTWDGVLAFPSIQETEAAHLAMERMDDPPAARQRSLWMDDDSTPL